MPDFTANIQLDIVGLDKLKNVEDRLSKINTAKSIDVDLKIDEGNLKNIETRLSALAKNPITIDLKFNDNGFRTFLRNLPGNSAGANFARDFQRGMDSTLQNNHIAQSVNRMLANGISNDIIDDARKRMETLIQKGIQINKIQEKFSGKKGLNSFRIDGIDELGNAVTIMERLTSAKKGKWSTNTTYTNVFHNMAKEASEAKKALSELESIREKLNTHSYDAELSKYRTSLSKYGQSDSASNSHLSDARRYAEEYERLLHQMRTATDDELSTLSDQLDTVGKSLKNSLSMVGDTLGKDLDISKKLKAKADITSFVEKNGRAVKKYGQQMEELKASAELLNTEIDFSNWQKKFNSLKSNVVSDGLGGNSFFSKLKKAAGTISSYISTAEIINGLEQAGKQMVDAVLKIDTAMTNLYKVTDNTKQEYDAFTESAKTSSVELGRTTSSYIEQTATWAKLGYTLKESADLAKASSIYANVGEVNDETAVSDLVTVMKAYDMRSSQVMDIVDRLNELGNNYATSAADLGNGLTNAASAMETSGTSLDKTLAMLTGGSEITQKAGEFGNFLKIGSMRIRGMKGALEELGEEVESSVDSISKVQTQILNLTSGKVNIFDEAGAFRDYYDIMSDISNVFDELSSTERASLSEILFGKQRGNQGAALIKAFQSGRIQEAYETAQNSSESAAKEQEKWLESLEAKIQQFKASFENLSTSFISSDFLKGIVDFGTTALNILTKLVDKIGVLATLGSGAGIGLLVKNFGNLNKFALHGCESMVA